MHIDVDDLTTYARKCGLTEPADLRAQAPENAVPLLLHVRKFFEYAVLESSDQPKEGLVLPRNIVYHSSSAILVTPTTETFEPW